MENFRKKEIHGVIHEAFWAVENKKICSALFVYLAQAFDNDWYQGLVYEISKIYPNRHFSSPEPIVFW